MLTRYDPIFFGGLYHHLTIGHPPIKQPGRLDFPKTREIADWGTAEPKIRDNLVWLKPDVSRLIKTLFEDVANGYRIRSYEGCS